MYLGQTEVRQEDFDVFMSSAELFKVKGLYKENGRVDFEANTSDETDNSKDEEVNYTSESLFPNNPQSTHVKQETNSSNDQYRILSKLDASINSEDRCTEDEGSSSLTKLDSE